MRGETWLIKKRCQDDVTVAAHGLSHANDENSRKCFVKLRHTMIQHFPSRRERKKNCQYINSYSDPKTIHITGGYRDGMRNGSPLCPAEETENGSKKIGDCLKKTRPPSALAHKHAHTQQQRGTRRGKKKRETSSFDERDDGYEAFTKVKPENH